MPVNYEEHLPDGLSNLPDPQTDIPGSQKTRDSWLRLKPPSREFRRPITYFRAILAIYPCWTIIPCT